MVEDDPTRPEKPGRRTFTADELAILEQYDACVGDRDKGAPSCAVRSVLLPHRRVAAGPRRGGVERLSPRARQRRLSPEAAALAKANVASL